MIALPDRQKAVEMLIKNEKVREALRPEIHIHLLKYLIAIGMGFGKEQELKIFEDKLRANLGNASSLNTLIEIPTKSSYQEL